MDDDLTEGASGDDQHTFFAVPISPAEWVNVPTIGGLDEESADAILRDINEQAAVSQTEDDDDEELQIAAAGIFTRRTDRLWRNTSHVFGYLATSAKDGQLISARDGVGDRSLIGKTVKLTLNHLRISSYPGGGERRVLFDFFVENQVAGGTGEPVHFNHVYRVSEGGSAGIAGYPIFVGLNVDANGLAFKAYTVCVSNSRDDGILAILESDVMKMGLKLATTAQPALVPLSQIALGLTRFVATRRKNVPVQDAYIGLDFADNQAGARLRRGDFVVVQLPPEQYDTWKWSEWRYVDGKLIDRAGRHAPYNYFVVGVT
jgi:hypothetical protein